MTEVVSTMIRTLATLLFAFCVTVLQAQPSRYVNPKIGTAAPGNRWMLFPGATTPFGMVALSPDNLDRSGWYKGGFDPRLGNIAGFSHFHAWTMAGLLTMPTTGKTQIKPGPQNKSSAGYRSAFSNDIASPGYYSVFLNDYNIKAELTATTRTGFHQYTFPQSPEAHVILDINFPSEYGFNLVKAHIKKISDTEIAGYARQVENYYTSPWQDYTLHFVIRFEKPFTSVQFWKNDALLNDSLEAECILNEDMGAVVNYATTEGERIKMQTAFSLVSIEQARLNLATETAAFGWDFEKAHTQAASQWNEVLGKVEVEGDSEADKTKFYTALYRTYCARQILSDANGQYKDACEQTQSVPAGTAMFGCDAFWNSFWNLNQVWTLLTPDYTNAWVTSLLEMYKHTGWLPKGPAGIEYSSIMEGEHEIALMVAAYQKGIRGYDAALAYEAMKKMQSVPGGQHGCGGHAGNANLEVYKKLGYVPYEEGPVSNTLEYAYDDWCVAQMALALNKKTDYDYFLKRSGNYKNVFDSTTSFTRPRATNGQWLAPFDPLSQGARKNNLYEDQTSNSYTDYIEGNAWQYTFFVPHDVAGLVKLIGREKFNDRLLKGFESAAKQKFSSPEYVNHSNQPNMQAPYLFNYSGMPWQTQYWSREIMEHYYGLTPEDGYQGDEDEGQMSAWLVISAMGLFEMDGGTSQNPYYDLTTPLFKKITVYLDNRFYAGKKFVIEAKQLSKQNRYIQSALLNGKPLTQARVPFAEVAKGGSLVLQMGPKPNKKWGVK